MKKIFLIFTLIFSFATLATSRDSALRRSNGLLRFVAQQDGVRDTAVASVIGSRCSRYLVDYEKRPCKEAVKKMMVLLDYDIVFYDQYTKDRYGNEWTPKSFVFVAFKKNLVSLLNSEKTSQYLSQLNQDLYKYLSEENSETNIFEITKSFYGSEDMASLVMAALFQDTSAMKLHLAYLDRTQTRGNAHFQSNMELLSRVIDTINLILDSSEEHYRRLFYPEAVQKNLNRNIYHFYVPLYLSKSLEKNGVEKQMAYTAALLLTLSYEFLTSANDYRYLFEDPETITATGKIKDIFGGYCGSNIGVRGMKFNMNFEPIRSTFERSTADAVQMLLRH